MALKTLHDLYLDELKDLYSAEQQELRAMQKMVNAANRHEVKTALVLHMDRTREQIKRLDDVFAKMGKKPGGKKCKGMEALIKEGAEMGKTKADPGVKDAGLISAAQRIEHYEMAAYGTARTHARQLGEAEAADALQHTLDEEGEEDRLLTDIALTMADPAANKRSPEYGRAYYVNPVKGA